VEVAVGVNLLVEGVLVVLLFGVWNGLLVLFSCGLFVSVDVVDGEVVAVVVVGDEATTGSMAASSLVSSSEVTVMIYQYSFVCVKMCTRY